MTESHDIQVTIGPGEVAGLLEEIRRYLEAVDAFRHEGHEPSWRHETQVEVLR